MKRVFELWVKDQIEERFSQLFAQPKQLQKESLKKFRFEQDSNP